MADTSNQAAPPRATLQNEIDFQTGKAGGFMVTIVVKDKAGSCILPDFVNARFINCKFDSLQTNSTNIIYMKDCELKSGSGFFKLRKAAMIAENTIVNNKIEFDQSKIELLECSIKQMVILKDVSFLKSIHCIWDSGEGSNSDTAVFLEGSRFESYDDIWNTWDDYTIKSTKKSFAKIVRPSKIDGTNQFAFAEEQSGISLWNLPNIDATEADKAFFHIDKSLLEIYNSGNISCQEDVFDVTDSKVIIRNVDKFESTDNDLGTFGSSSVDISQVPQFFAKIGEGFSFTDSNIVMKEVDEIIVTKNLLSLDNTSFLFIGNEFDYNDSKAEGPVLKITGGETSDWSIELINGSVATFKNVLNIDSANNVILLNDSTLYYSNSYQISSQQGTLLKLENSSMISLDTMFALQAYGDYLIDSSNSKVSVHDISLLYPPNGTVFYFTNNSSGIVKNISNLHGGTHVVDLIDSSLVIENCTEQLLSDNDTAIYVGTNGRVSLSNINKINSQSFKAIDIYGKYSMMKMKNVATITGDISAVSSDFLIDNSEIKGIINGKINVAADVPGGYRLSMQGPLSVTGVLQASKYVIDYSGITFKNDVSLTGCIVTERASTIQGTLTAAGTYINSVLVNTQGSSILSNYSVLLGVGYKADKAITLVKSVISSWASQFEDVTLASSAGFSFDLGSAGDITATDSFIKIFGGSIGSVSYSGNSTLLGGAISSTTITPPTDDPLSPVAFFVTGGDMGIEADGTIYMEADKLNSIFRDTVLMQYKTDITIETTNGDMLLKASGNITVQSTSGTVYIKGSPNIQLN
jgi:hypothetical protein